MRFVGIFTPRPRPGVASDGYRILRSDRGAMPLEAAKISPTWLHAIPGNGTTSDPSALRPNQRDGLGETCG